MTKQESLDCEIIEFIKKVLKDKACLPSGHILQELEENGSYILTLSNHQGKMIYSVSAAANSKDLVRHTFVLNIIVAGIARGTEMRENTVMITDMKAENPLSIQRIEPIELKNLKNPDEDD